MVVAATLTHGSAPGSGPEAWGIELVQTAQPRDLGALALVIGLFLILLVVTLLAGGPDPIL